MKSQLKPILKIENLEVVATSNNHGSGGATEPEHKTILHGLNLSIDPGTIHVIMGPNGAGKTTLSQILIRNPEYQVTRGEICYLGENLLELTPTECALKGIFLSFQNPISLPGVSGLQFLKTSYNAIRKYRNLPPMDAVDFVKLVKQQMHRLQIPEEFLYRGVNEDFSGGEKKRNEILQLLLLEPTLMVLDEIDSGLDLDALKLIATNIKACLNPQNAILIITHYPKIFDYLIPDQVHILANKKIVQSGDYTLIKKLETEGYSWVTN